MKGWELEIKFVYLGMEEINKDTIVDLDGYTDHILTIKKLTVDTYGQALTDYCHANIFPGIASGLMLLHLQNPEKDLPDLEMVLFCLVKEASKFTKFKKTFKHINTQKVLFDLLDEALELTKQAGFN